MESVLNLTVRDWMVIIGSLLIVAVVVDAWRRMRREKTSRLRMKLASPVDEEFDELSMLRELPNGGARVLKREDLLAARKNHAAGLAKAAVKNSAKSRTGDQQEATKRAESQAKPAVSPKDSSNKDPLGGVRPDRDEPANLDWLEDISDDTDIDQEHAGGELPRNVETEVIILHVVAADERGFDGSAILEILLACDLRFGDMEFFHRHEREAGRGAIQFSVANMLQPGIFDIDNMGSMRTRGLVFFLTMPGPEDMTLAFDYMLETARTVARNLSGEVLDESRSVLTEQSVELARQQILDLERRMLLAQPR